MATGTQLTQSPIPQDRMPTPVPAPAMPIPGHTLNPSWTPKPNFGGGVMQIPVPPGMPTPGDYSRLPGVVPAPAPAPAVPAPAVPTPQFNPFTPPQGPQFGGQTGYGMPMGYGMPIGFGGPMAGGIPMYAGGTPFGSRAGFIPYGMGPGLYSGFPHGGPQGWGTGMPGVHGPYRLSGQFGGRQQNPFAPAPQQQGGFAYGESNGPTAGVPGSAPSAPPTAGAPGTAAPGAAPWANMPQPGQPGLTQGGGDMQAWVQSRPRYQSGTDPGAYLAAIRQWMQSRPGFAGGGVVSSNAFQPLTGYEGTPLPETSLVF